MTKVGIAYSMVPILLLALVFTGPAAATVQWFAADGAIGGGDAMDGIDGNAVAGADPHEALADGDMAGGDQGWPYDAWHGWTFPETGTPDCPRCKPVIRALQEEVVVTPEQEIVAAQGQIDDAVLLLDEALAWLG